MFAHRVRISISRGANTATDVFVKPIQLRRSNSDVTWLPAKSHLRSFKFKFSRHSPAKNPCRRVHLTSRKIGLLCESQISNHASTSPFFFYSKQQGLNRRQARRGSLSVQSRRELDLHACVWLPIRQGRPCRYLNISWRAPGGRIRTIPSVALLRGCDDN